MRFISLRLIIPVAILIALWCINAHYEIFAVNAPRGEGIEKREGTFRVMTYNVNSTMGDKEHLDKFSNSLIKEIEKHDPDIVCFQELAPKVFNEIYNSLDSLFGYTDSMEIMKEPLRFWIFSKDPIRNLRRYLPVTDIDTTGFNQTLQDEIEFLKTRMPFFSAEIEVEPNRWITVFSCHLRSNAYSTARRSMEEGSSWWDGISLYHENYKIGKKIRDFEADNMRIFLDSLESIDKPIIIAGDFNDWSGSYGMNTICSNKYKDAWWEGGFGFGITYDAMHLKLRLDHILYSHHFEMDKVYVWKSDFSDHYPLICDFSLQQNLYPESPK